MKEKNKFHYSLDGICLRCAENIRNSNSNYCFPKKKAPVSDEDDMDNHRITLRVPNWLIDKIDSNRYGRLGKVSRNLFILEIIEKALEEE